MVGGHGKGHDGGHDQEIAFLSATEVKILSLLIKRPANRAEITNHLGYAASTRNVHEALSKSLGQGQGLTFPSLLGYTLGTDQGFA